MKIDIPVTNVPINDSSGLVTKQWRAFFAQVAKALRGDTGSVDDLEVLASAPTAESAISDLKQRVAQLEEMAFQPQSFQKAINDLQAMMPAPTVPRGNVAGPLTSTDNAVARWDGATGKRLQNSVVVIDDTGSIVGVLDLSARSLYLQDSNASHFLRFIAGSDLTANRTLTILTGDADRTLDITGGSLTISSGAYTPTLTNFVNLAASTAYECQYLRVGSTVGVSGKVDVDPTAAVATRLGISLPIASNFGAVEDCGGTAFCPDVAGFGAAIRADAANNRADMAWIAVDLANQAMHFSFAYQVIP